MPSRDRTDSQSWLPSITSYEYRIKAAYPLHPELLDQLYEDWSASPRFRRTRGVLSLISKVVHDLWVNGDAGTVVHTTQLNTTQSGILSACKVPPPPGVTHINPL